MKNRESFRRFRLSNGAGIEVELLSLGATVTSIKVREVSIQENMETKIN